MDRQCSSCGGFCKKSRCERENVKPKIGCVNHDCDKCKEWEAVCDQHLRHIKKLKKQRTWVGLTDEDKKEYVAQDFGGNRLDAMDWAEKRLKEKNT